jgi:hypothetical protein
MASTVANKLKYLLCIGAVNFSSDTFKIILMGTGFVFNKDTHHTYADVSASELATGYGYTRNSKTLAGIVIAEDDNDDRTEITWSSVSWTASGGNIGPTPGAIIFDDTVTTPVADPIIGYLDFLNEATQVDGGTGTLNGIEFRLI